MFLICNNKKPIQAALVKSCKNEGLMEMQINSYLSEMQFGHMQVCTYSMIQ